MDCVFIVHGWKEVGPVCATEATYVLVPVGSDLHPLYDPVRGLKVGEGQLRIF